MKRTIKKPITRALRHRRIKIEREIDRAFAKFIGWYKFNEYGN